MATISFNNGIFSITGSGHVDLAPGMTAGDVLAALVQEPESSDFFLPDLFDLFSKQAAEDLRKAFQTGADVLTFKKYESLVGRYAGLQVGSAWDLEALVPVWRTKIETALIDEIIRVKDGRAFVVLTGTKQLLSEHDLYRRTLKTIGDHLDSIAADAATIARYTKLTLQAPIVECLVCVNCNAGLSTRKVYGPACLDASQWIMPKGFTYVSMAS